SGCPGFRSNPARLSASAEWCHVLGATAPGKGGTPGKYLKMKVVPAAPSTADVAVHVSEANLASILISTLLASLLPQTLAANWKAISRCCPSVVPVLPPTGATGVGSLNPSPGLLPLTTVIMACPKAALETKARIPIRASERNASRRGSDCFCI